MKRVTVTQNCNAYFNYSVDLTNLVTFIDSSNPSAGFYIISWYWDFGDVTDFNNAYTINLQGNAFSVDIHLQEVAGINSLTKEDITISPNPFTNKIELYYNDKAHENINIYIYSLLGNIVYQTEIPSSETKTVINLNNINAGAYFIKISSPSTKPITKKIIKK